MIGGLVGAYKVLFYFVATQVLGGWSPMDVDYSNLYATPFPFLVPLRSGVIPALDEELFYRLIGIIQHFRVVIEGEYMHQAIFAFSGDHANLSGTV